MGDYNYYVHIICCTFITKMGLLSHQMLAIELLQGKRDGLGMLLSPPKVIAPHRPDLFQNKMCRAI